MHAHTFSVQFSISCIMFLTGQDFVIDSLDVIIPAFETANSIPISGIAISDDSLPEVTEGFRVSLSFKDFDTTCSEQNCSRCDCCRTAAVQNIFTIATTVSTVVTIQDNDGKHSSCCHGDN